MRVCPVPLPAATIPSTARKAKSSDKLLFKWTLIASIVFAVAVIAAYVIQPDFNNGNAVDYWQNLTKYADLFKNS